MKTIIIKCSQDGKISTNNDNLILSKENESVKVTIDYGSILPTYTKRADIYVDYDETYDFVTGTIANQLVFNLTFIINKIHLVAYWNMLNRLCYN